MVKYRHPYIVLLLGVVSSPHCYLITETIEASLYQMLMKGTITGQERSKWSRQILLAVAYLHGHGIVHRSITTSAFFIDERGNIKLG